MHDAGSASNDVIGPRLLAAICDESVVYVDVLGFGDCDCDDGGGVVDMAGVRMFDADTKQGNAKMR